MHATVLVGCRGYDHDPWVGRFYPPDLPRERRLEFYSERCRTVLVQETYHRLPTPDEVTFWRNSTPESFRFSFVAPRSLALDTRVQDPRGELERFLDLVRPLGPRLGIVNHVVPRERKVHVSLVEHFLEEAPRDVRHAVEFNRNEWYTERTREVLENLDAACSIHDSPDCTAPWWITADHVLVRRYGALGKGTGRYTSDEIRSLAARIREDVLPERTVYLYFENVEMGHAAEHVALLREILSS